ncbi:MAG TPA: phage holin family protein [Kofleriaceae bacterium]|nr:phage holin family protein [Kofleriaceae bacterium]
MSPAVVLLIKLGIRLVVFTGVFWLAAKKNDKVIFEKKWATPLVALTFAVLNTALYWVLSKLVNLATLGAVSFLMPLVINGLLLGITVRVFQSKKHWFRIDGWLAMMWMAIALTAAHGLLWLGVDYIPKHI